MSFLGSGFDGTVPNSGRNPWWTYATDSYSSLLRRTKRALALLSCLAPASACAQHLHIQTSFSPTPGWYVFWFDFDAGPFAAADFNPKLTSPMRREIPAAAGFNLALGSAGDPMWILPEVQTPEAPSIGFGTQGSGLSGGQIRLRLASYSGPGDFAVYVLSPFGGAQFYVMTRNGLGPEDAVTLTFPGGHTHLNLAFNRPGLYQLGWRAEGTRADNGQPTQSDIVVFNFQVNPPSAPRLLLDRNRSSQDTLDLKIESEPGLPLRVDSSTNALHWTPLAHLRSVASPTTMVVTNSPGTLFLRASHPLP